MHLCTLLGPVKNTSLSECTYIFVAHYLPSRCHVTTDADLCFRLTNTKPSAIFRVRSHLPSNAPIGQPSPPAQLGIEIAPLPHLEAIAAGLSQSASASGAGAPDGDGKGKELVKSLDVGKVAEKVVRNVSLIRLLLL